MVAAVSMTRCQSKRVYQSWSEAEHEAIHLIEDLRDGKLSRAKGQNVYAYRCDDCEKYHIGHQPPSRFFSKLAPR